MYYPKKLNPGDRIGLICPSSPIKTERIQKCIEKIQDMGYQVAIADNLDTPYAGYMAGNGETRAKWINKMFEDPAIDAIFCIRGGDGGSRVIEFLDYDIIRNNPKIFLGYSDVTCVHLAINQLCHFVTFHGPMVSSNMIDDFDEESASSLWNTLNADYSFTFHNPKGIAIEIFQTGIAQGRLIGGNLSLLSASIGTSYEVDTKGNILFIEEIDESVTKLEKWLYHLRLSGKLSECSGLLLGQFTDCYTEDDSIFDLLDCIRDVLSGIHIPVLYNIQSGHGKPMMTLPMGAQCRINGYNGEIHFEVKRD